MALPTLTSLTGLLILLYLATFVVFALLRIVTGISIQRLGWYGLRRISFIPRDGIKIELRGLRLSAHRPSFAQPTYLSVVLEELKVTLDLKALREKTPKSGPPKNAADGSSEKAAENNATPDRDAPEAHDNGAERSRTWQKLTEVKERIKRLHRKLDWIRMVDFVATTTSVVIQDVGSIQVASFTAAVDTRRKTVDRSRLFQHRRATSEHQTPAEWIFTVRSVLFMPEGQESTEILDNCTLNIHGLLYKELDGLRDASIALKLGRLNIPYDDLHTCMERMKQNHASDVRRETVVSDDGYSFSDLMDELDHPGSREESIVRTVSDSKEFISSILRGIQEVQFAVSFFGMSKRLRAGGKKESPVYLNMSMKEVGLDLLRLDQRSPAHLMYFSSSDIAHQALIAAISISVGIDHGQSHPERLMYIPMATTTIKTTLPAKTIQFDRERNVAERNTNIFFANLVVTSPSVDFDPRHLPLVLALLQKDETPDAPVAPESHTRRHLISRLLPKSSVKISIHEPVVRISLPPMEAEKKGTDEYDLLISTMSSISLDVESSHSAGGDLHYSLSSNFRVTSHQLYYQTASREKHNLLMTDTAEVRLNLEASPEVTVVIMGNFQTFSLFMVRPEISEGVRQIVSQLRQYESTVATKSSTKPKEKFLRKLPRWLAHIELQGSDFNVEIAGVDPDVSEHSRGIAFHLDSWTAEYKADKTDEHALRLTRRRATSRTISRDEGYLRSTSPGSSPTPRRKRVNETDGRRLAIHIQGLEGFVIESSDTREGESFVALPRFEVAFTTSTDHQGPIFHINSFARSLYVQYSLYRHFAIGVATMVLRKAFAKSPAERSAAATTAAREYNSLSVPAQGSGDFGALDAGRPEIVTLDFKVGFLQAKANLPSDPPLMIQMHGFEAGRHRWAAPFARAKLARLYAEAPGLKKVWTRMVSVKGLRVDLRESRRTHGRSVTEEKSIDVSTDAIRLAVPHQLVVHKVFDNVTNVIKVTEQLHHRFKTASNEYILDKHPEGPKRVPKITMRSQALLFEIEDGSFEWKLGTIFRLGILEQKQRIAREEAFNLKVKKLAESEKRKGGRAKSAHGIRGRSKHRAGGEFERRSESEETGRRSRSGARGRRMRYDIDGTCDLSGNARVQVDQALDKLHRLHAQSWKKRIDHGLNSSKGAIQDIRAVFWGIDDMPEDHGEQTETILAIPQRPALMALLISDLSIIVDKPSFPLEKYPDYLHRVGKGMPKDMKYSMLLPMNLQVSMGEARMTLRDYPLPFLHVPAIRSGQSARLPSLSLKTDFVIAEEYRDRESTRQVQVEVVPPETLESGAKSGGFAVNVRRTVSPVKTYSDMKVVINTAQPTRITWGTSYQPAIQDMMQVIEGFTKPAVDPSERVGFWDKIRLSFHSRINVAWKGDGDVHLILKGSRDPYKVTGDGAGFVMCWRNDVRWNIGQDDDPKKFMTVDSGVYVLAIPDLSHYARQIENQQSDAESISSGSSFKSDASFRKTVMKLSGNVRWLSGLVFERNEDGGGRSFDFAPHYSVVLKHPDFAKSSGGKDYDAFRGFRSHYIHMSVAIVAPLDRDWSVANLKPSSNYNSVHLSPRFFSHFYSWWSMFSGAMSLPIRQGKLWPGVEKSSKKFGRHLATIKYNLLLSPLYMSHVYKHKDPDDFGQGVVSATGLKVRLDSFMLDLHMRREEFRSQAQQGPNKSATTTGMRINQVQLDFISADIRAVSASISGTDGEDLDETTNDTLASYQANSTAVDLSKFTIPDNDLSWIDMDDFVELDWILPAELNPETKILPLAFAPRFTYFRQTDHQDNISGDPHRSSPFGNEPTHFCVMSKQNDPRRVQCDLIQERLKKVDEQISQNQRAVGELELQLLRVPTGERNEDLQDKFQAFRDHSDNLTKKRHVLQTMYRSLIERLEHDDRHAVPDERGGESFEAPPEVYDATDAETKDTDATPLADYISDFNNRFIIHNAQLKWNNGLRNIILRYIHQVSQRRGFVYYMSRRAVKFILDIVDEQKKAKEEEPVATAKSRRNTSPMSPQGDDDLDVKDRIEQLLNDGKKFVDANDDNAVHSRKGSVQANVTSEDIAQDFTPQNTYHVRLIAPQIQLQSEKNAKSAVLVAAKGMQLKVIQIMDKDRVTDDVSGLVQRRFSAAMDSLQIFVTSASTFKTDYLHMYSGNTYGSSSTTAWPPWVPFEVMFEFDTNPYGFSRVVQRTSASMRYDKYNTLRLKYNDDVSGEDGSRKQSPDNAESRIDHLWVDFPHVRAICDSTQYYAMYIIVLDLLLYSEPLEKQRSEKLEKIMLASDFSDLNGAPELVVSLQERIRQLEEIKLRFQIHEQYLDREGWKNRIELERTLAENEEELFFMMKAITTSQRKAEERGGSESAQPGGLLRYYLTASEIVWHLVREGSESLAEFQLKNALFDRTDNSDGSHLNAVEIERIHGLNLLPSAVYPEMIAPYIDSNRAIVEGKDTKMLRVTWYMLEAIAGIPVMDHFEVNLFPLKVQLEHEVGKKLFEYVFPGAGKDAFEGGGFSPFMVKHMKTLQDEEDDEAAGVGVPENDGRTSPGSSRGPRNSSDETGPGALELRLQPTLALPDTQRPKSSSSKFSKFSHVGGHHVDLAHLRMFEKNGSGSMFRGIHGGAAKDTSDTLTVSSFRPSSRRSSSSKLSKMTGMDESTASVGSTTNTNKKRFGGLTRSPSSSRTRENGASSSNANSKQDNDLNQMMTRASNYMTFAYIKIPSMVLCLSYKGKGQRNFEDVHDLVFRMPTVEYRNKTWSNLDLALALKKDVIRALISHAGAIVGNKFRGHAHKRDGGGGRLRQIANPSVMLGGGSEGGSEDAGSSRDRSPEGEGGRRSFASGRDSAYSRPESGYASSSHSGHSHLHAGAANGHGHGYGHANTGNTGHGNHAPTTASASSTSTSTATTKHRAPSLRPSIREEPSFAEEISQTDIYGEGLRAGSFAGAGGRAGSFSGASSVYGAGGGGGNGLTRAITAMSGRSVGGRERGGGKEGEGEGGEEESIRHKSKLLFGKKFVQSLREHK